MTITVSKETVDRLAEFSLTSIELGGTCDKCDRPVHGLFGMLEAYELKRTGQVPFMRLLHNGGAFPDCVIPAARFMITEE